MALTASDLIRAALSAGQSTRIVQTEDVADAMPRVQPFLDGLAADRLTGAILSTDIPSRLFPSLVVLFAEELAEEFVGRPANLEKQDRYRALLLELRNLDRTSTASPLAKAVLEQMTVYKVASPAVDATLVDAELPDIFSSLALQNVIYVPSVTDVPDGAFPHLKRYVAAYMATPQMIPVMAEMKMELRQLKRALSFAPVRACYF